MGFVRIKRWYALIVLLGGFLISSSAAVDMPPMHLNANVGFDLRNIVARQLVRLTSPSHDPRQPASVMQSWAATLDRMLAGWFAVLDNMLHATLKLKAEGWNTGVPL